MKDYKFTMIDTQKADDNTVYETWVCEGLPYRFHITKQDGQCVYFFAVKNNEADVYFSLIGWQPKDNRWYLSVQEQDDNYQKLRSMMFSSNPEIVRIAADAWKVAADAMEAAYSHFFSGISMLPTDSMDARFAYIYAHGGTPIRTWLQLPKGKKDYIPVSLQPKDEKYSMDIAKDRWWARENLKDGQIKDTMAGGQAIDPKFITLHNKLLSFGGYETCFPIVEEDMDKILSRGQCWLGDHSRMMKGQPCRCHANAAGLWEANHKDHEVALATGYALSSDGVWRQHSWLVQRNARSISIIETTARRVAYFGFILTDKEAEEFADNNY